MFKQEHVELAADTAIAAPEVPVHNKNQVAESVATTVAVLETVGQLTGGIGGLLKKRKIGIALKVIKAVAGALT